MSAIPLPEPSLQRVDYFKASPAAATAMMALEAAVRKNGLETSLLHLVRLRASQINGCAYCLDLHTREARADGESERRLYLLQVWREALIYTERERAALAWTESLTLVASKHVPDDVFQHASQFFTEAELVNLTLAVVAINAWNRFSIGFNSIPKATVD